MVPRGCGDPSIEILKVRYLATGGRAKANRRFENKRAWFEYENEIRAVKTNSGPDGFKGCGIPVKIENLSALITELVISPFAPEWFHGLAKTVCDGFKA